MPDYRETELQGKSWQRAYAVHIENEYQQVPKLKIYEQKATTAGAVAVMENQGFISAEYNPNAVFDLLNPDTGAVIGSSTQLDLYVILHSLYIHLAKQRDLL